MTAPVSSDLAWLDDLERGKVPTHPVTRRGFADLAIDRPTLAAAIYHGMPYEDHESSDRFAELAEAAANEAWLFVRDLIDAQATLIAELRKRDAALREFATLADSYPLGTDVPVYRLHRILAAHLAPATPPAQEDTDA